MDFSNIIFYHFYFAATGLFAVCTNFISLAICSSMVTFTLSAYVTLQPVIVMDLLGMENMENAFGFLLLAEGIAIFIGSPIVGFLYDQLHSYTPGFLFSGIVVAASGIMLFFIPILQKSTKRNQFGRGNGNDQTERLIGS